MKEDTLSYIRDNKETLEGLLKAYFDEIDAATTTDKITAIKKLVIYTLNQAYFENDDFNYIASDAMPNIEYLGLQNATISDNKTINKIASNTLKDKTSIKTLILSKTLTTIGDNAFANVNLGRISTNRTFRFLSIPSSPLAPPVISGLGNSFTLLLITSLLFELFFLFII